MRVLIHVVDDDELVRASISYMLSNHGYSTEIYSSGEEFFFGNYHLKGGCVLLDICMPGMGGHEVQEELARRGNSLPVVAMSVYGDLPAVVRAMKLGAIDFIEKPLSEQRLLGVVARALMPAGKGGVPRKATAPTGARLDRLTPREREILQGLLDGLSNKGIADRLGISSRTVEMHRTNMKCELGVTSLSQIVMFAIEAGLIPIRKSDRHQAASPIFATPPETRLSPLPVT